MNYILTLLTVSVALLSLPALSNKQLNPMDSAQLEQKIDRLFSRYNGNVPGAVVGIIRDSEVLVAKGYGMANLESQEPVTPRTNFRLASVSKQFTAMSLLLLVNDGRLSLEDNVTSVIPGFPNYGRRIHMHHLLSHQSGLLKYERNVPPGQKKQLTDADVLKILKKQNKTMFRPGTKYKYSNSGYALIANIVALTSGRSYSKFLEERIFHPLEMNRSVAHIEGETRVDDRAYGYTRKQSRFVRTDQNIFSAVLGDGGVYMSLEDYIKWDQALYQAELLKPKLMKKIFQRQKLKNGNYTGYGFGWRVGTYRGTKWVHHTGSSIGFKNVVFRFPQKKLTIIVLTNRTQPSPKGIAQSIANLLL